MFNILIVSVHSCFIFLFNLVFINPCCCWTNSAPSLSLLNKQCTIPLCLLNKLSWSLSVCWTNSAPSLSVCWVHHPCLSAEQTVLRPCLSAEQIVLRPCLLNSAPSLSVCWTVHDPGLLTNSAPFPSLPSVKGRVWYTPPPTTLTPILLCLLLVGSVLNREPALPVSVCCTKYTST